MKAHRQSRNAPSADAIATPVTKWTILEPLADPKNELGLPLTVPPDVGVGDNPTQVSVGVAVVARLLDAGVDVAAS